MNQYIPRDSKDNRTVLVAGDHMRLFLCVFLRVSVVLIVCCVELWACF